MFRLADMNYKEIPEIKTFMTKPYLFSIIYQAYFTCMYTCIQYERVIQISTQIHVIVITCILTICMTA